MTALVGYDMLVQPSELQSLLVQQLCTRSLRPNVHRRIGTIRICSWPAHSLILVPDGRLDTLICR